MITSIEVQVLVPFTLEWIAEYDAEAVLEKLNYEFTKNAYIKDEQNKKEEVLEVKFYSKLTDACVAVKFIGREPTIPEQVADKIDGDVKRIYWTVDSWASQNQQS